jgi:hypothetical protein
MIRPFLSSFFLLLIVSNLYAFNSEEEKKEALNSYLSTQYNLLQSGSEKPDFELYQKGMIGFYKLKMEGKVSKDIITLIDFRMSSTKKRMWIIDVNTNEVIHHTIVAHGKNSGWEFAKTFSNTPNTNMSSIGFYLTGEKYYGKYGLSLRLDGVEKGFNSNARRRAIVLHPAKYVNYSISKSLGRMGRSFGCPSIPYKDSDKVVKTIAERSVMFIYYPQEDYLKETKFSDEMAAYAYLSGLGMIV